MDDPTRHELVFNGIVVGEIEHTGDPKTDADVAMRFLKDNGLYKEISPLKTLFRQALSFNTTAVYLNSRGMTRSPWDGYLVAPFVVNSAFSIELYLKALGQAHGETMRGHDLIELLDKLPAAAHQAIDDVLPMCIAERGPAGAVDFRTCVGELKNAFVDWRYLHEKTHTDVIHIDRVIFAMKVVDEACRKTPGITD